MKKLTRIFSIFVFLTVAFSITSCDYDLITEKIENGEVASFTNPNDTQSPGDGQGNNSGSNEEDEGIGE